MEKIQPFHKINQIYLMDVLHHQSAMASEKYAIHIHRQFLELIQPQMELETAKKEAKKYANHISQGKQVPANVHKLAQQLAKESKKMTELKSKLSGLTSMYVPHTNIVDDSDFLTSLINCQ